MEEISAMLWMLFNQDTTVEDVILPALVEATQHKRWVVLNHLQHNLIKVYCSVGLALHALALFLGGVLCPFVGGLYTTHD